METAVCLPNKLKEVRSRYELKKKKNTLTGANGIAVSEYPGADLEGSNYIFLYGLKEELDLMKCSPRVNRKLNFPIVRSIRPNLEEFWRVTVTLKEREEVSQGKMLKDAGQLHLFTLFSLLLGS